MKMRHRKRQPTMISISNLYYFMYIVLSDSSKDQSLTEYHKYTIIGYTYCFALIFCWATVKKTKEVIHPINNYILNNN